AARASRRGAGDRGRDPAVPLPAAGGAGPRHRAGRRRDPTGMRLGILVEQVLAPVPGGTGRYARELAAALAATAPAGASVTGWTAWHRDLGPARIPGVAGPRRLPVPR